MNQRHYIEKVADFWGTLHDELNRDESISDFNFWEFMHALKFPHLSFEMLKVHLLHALEQNLNGLLSLSRSRMNALFVLFVWSGNK